MASSVEADSKKDDLLALAREQFEEYCDATVNTRALAEKARDYKDGNQWTAEERNTLKKRKQPCITDNKIADKCNTLMGMERQMRADPKAFPRNPGDEEAAEAATDALRFISDSCDYNRTVRKPGCDNLMVEGIAAGQVIVEKSAKNPKVCAEHIRWDRVYYDVHALRDDFDDKTYCGYFRWDDYDKAKREFKGYESALEQAVNDNTISAFERAHADKPVYVQTVRSRKRVQIFKHYMRKDGVWHEGVWCKGGWLEPLKPCAYKDEDGKPICCLEIQALYRDSDGNPYGEVQRYLDIQDEHNKRRSKMLHLLNAKRIVMQNGMVTDANGGIDGLRSEIHKPDGVVQVNGDIAQFRVEDNLAEAQGQWQLLQQTDAALSATGPNLALMGQTGSNSGRAKELDQQAGAMLVSSLYDALDAWETRMYRQMWMRVKQYWTAETWIRVTDDEDKVKFVALNERMTQGHLEAQALKSAPMQPAEKAQAVQQIANDPRMQLPAMDESGKPMMKNDVSRMDVDIIITRTADTVNIQQEQFEILANLADKRPEVPFKVIVQASQLRSDIKKQIVDALTGENDPQAQAMAQMQQQMAELEKAFKEAQVRKELASASQAEQAAQEAHIDTAVKVATFISGESQTPAKTSVGVN